MKRITLLIAAVLAMAVMLAPTASAQNPSTEGCPPGTVVNAAGTTCTDQNTGEIVVDTGTTGPRSSPCPESSPEILWSYDEASGTCVERPGPLADDTPTPSNTTPTPPADDIPTPSSTTSTSPASTGASVSVLPATGGPDFGLTAVGVAVLVFAGWIGISYWSTRSDS